MKTGASLTLVTLTAIFWVDEFIPSVAVIVPLYDDWVSKSGADEKVKTPLVLIDKPSPETLNAIDELSTSVAVTVPIAVWFSAAVNVAEEVITGATSSTSVTFTVILPESEKVPSETVNVAV